MRTTLLALGIVALCLGGFAVADGEDARNPVYEPARAPHHGRFTIFRIKEGTVMLDTTTGHTWRLEFQDKAGYTWSQIPRGIMRDPEYEIPNPVTGK